MTPASARNGTKARSWNSRMPKDSLPCVRFSSPWSDSCCITMAVEDIATAPPSTTATSGGEPSHQAMAPNARAVNPTWALPSANTSLRMAIRRGSENSSPRVNSRKTTPNSASVVVVSVSSTQPSACGPSSAPTARNPRTGGRRRRPSVATTSSVAASSTRTSTSTLSFMETMIPVCLGTCCGRPGNQATAALTAPAPAC